MCALGTRVAPTVPPAKSSARTPPTCPVTATTTIASPDAARSVGGAEGESARASIDVAVMRRLPRTPSSTFAGPNAETDPRPTLARAVTKSSGSAPCTSTCAEASSPNGHAAQRSRTHSGRAAGMSTTASTLPAS